MIEQWRTQEILEQANRRQVRRDNELIRLYTEQKSEQAFAELTRRYANLVYTTCLWETGRRDWAEDAAQEVFVLLSRKAHTLKNCDTLSGWLYTASRYLAKNLSRQERRRQMTETAAVENTLLPSALFANPLWERIEPHFHDALDRLKPTDREAILLRFVQTQSLAEVGNHLGLSENTARMRITRALEKIRKHLGKAGITVTVAVLAVLLEEHSAHAAPVSLVQRLSQTAGVPQTAGQSLRLSKAARAAAWRLFLVAHRTLLMLLGGGVLLGGMAIGYHLAHPPRLSTAERQRMFLAWEGTWRGTLAFADDRTHQRFTYPTQVQFETAEQNSVLRFTARYQGTSSVDITTLRVEPTTGKVTVQNGGKQSSHSLRASGELLRLPNGGAAFEGTDSLTRRTVRLRFTLDAKSAVIEEEYRLPGASAYQFRNRFLLQKP